MSDLDKEPSVSVIENVYDILQRGISRQWVTLNQHLGDHITDSSTHNSRKIDHEIESLLIAGQCLVTKISTRVKYLRQLREGSGLPFQFPVELLVQIFSLVCHKTWDEIIKEEPRTTDDYVSKLHILAQVCTRWKAIVEGTPELWSLVISDCKKSSTTAALRWSKAYPLDVVADPTSSNNPLFWPLVTKEIHRWNRAHLDVYIPHARSSAPWHLQALEKPATILTDLDLFGYSEIPQEQTIALNLFAGSAPKLLHLSLKSIALQDWGSQILRGLRSINLTKILTNGPSAVQMMTVLQACPGLRNLTLQRVSFSNHNLPRNYPTVYLRRLQGLNLLLNPKTTISLLETIRAPKCTYNNFEIDTVGSPDTSQLLTAIKVFVSSAFRVGLAACNDIELSINSRVQIHVPITDGFLTLILPTLAGGSAIWSQWMTHVLHPLLSAIRKIIPINLSWAPRGRVSIADIEYLLRQPTIVSLEMEGWDMGSEDLLQALSVASPDTHGGHSWYWPALRYLDLTRCECSPRTLLQLVTNRMEAEVGTRANEKGIERLRRLSVRKCGMDQQTFEAIRCLIGGAAVWDDDEGESDHSTEDVTQELTRGR
ncbi:hypothetical protein FRB95_002101 [Tulasnella sp. JGI-2019a]|nr:hypothetical protein FRB95_002101 [Tulasnella sp. JGI-2019a]